MVGRGGGSLLDFYGCGHDDNLLTINKPVGDNVLDVGVAVGLELAVADDLEVGLSVGDRWRW